MYGSMATGLAIDSSDMDLLISGVFGENQKIIGFNLASYVDRHVMIDKMQLLYHDL
jgi:DNA polymerase sigma